ncbi:putative MFS-type transporter [Pectobacterium sp. F1-1]|nr:putative MFS-type transporter [Pectobacterium sp. F1-1]
MYCRCATREWPAAASLILSAYAVGSCLAGLLFGALKLRTALHRLLLLGGLATTITTLPLLVAGSIPTLAMAVLIAGLILTLLLVAGHFMAFTFVRPLLLSISGFDARWIGALLFAYGMAGIVGNFLAGLIAARRTVLALMAIALGLLLTPILFLTIGGSHSGGVVTLLIWGLAYGGVSVGLMTWMMKAAPRAVEIAAALYVGIFNVGIALGSWIGGQVVDSAGLLTTLWLTGGCATVALLLSLSMTQVGHSTIDS